MAKKSMIAREAKRQKLIRRHHTKRNELKKIIKTSSDMAEIISAQEKLTKLPTDSSQVRLNTRCQLCGRPHAVYRRFKLCRICLRQQLMAGNIPGGKKSSW